MSYHTLGGYLDPLGPMQFALARLRGLDDRDGVAMVKDLMARELLAMPDFPTYEFSVGDSECQTFVRLVDYNELKAIVDTLRSRTPAE